MKEYLNRLIDGELLSRQDTHDILLGIIAGKYNDCQIAALLMAMQTRGVTVDELLGFRDGLLETGKPINLDDYNTLDIVGTGGDGKNTFNISTCSAFVMSFRVTELSAPTTSRSYAARWTRPVSATSMHLSLPMA